MREIKLRAKPRDLAHEQFSELYKKRELDFVYGTGLYHDRINTWLILENFDKEPFSCLKSVIVDPETVGQYTGLKDKNGKEIYEGDIWAIRDNRLTVEFKEDRAGWFPFATDDGCGCCSDQTYQPDYGEIIGNIHSNPELLEVKP